MDLDDEELEYTRKLYNRNNTQNEINDLKRRINNVLLYIDINKLTDDNFTKIKRFLTQKEL